jgi:hypothetical protein
MAEWISVEDRLPTEEEYINVGNDGTETYSRILIAFKTETIDYELGCYDGYKWMNELGNRSISDVIAWKIFVPKYPNSRKPTMAKKEFIEREAVIAFLENMAASRYLIQCFENKEKFPAADVVEVVRCKDCEHARPIDKTKAPEKYFKDDCVVCECEDVIGEEPMIYRPDHFCSYGERRCD